MTMFSMRAHDNRRVEWNNSQNSNTVELRGMGHVALIINGAPVQGATITLEGKVPDSNPEVWLPVRDSLGAQLTVNATADGITEVTANDVIGALQEIRFVSATPITAKTQALVSA